MKTIYTLGLFFLFLFISGCQSNDDKVDTTQEIFMRALVNGDSFEVFNNPSNVQAFLYYDTDNVLNFNMRGIDDKDQRIEFGVKEFNGIGTYNLKFNLNDQSDWGQIRLLKNNNDKDYVEYNTQSALTKDGRGSLIITSVDDEKVEGSFEFFVGGVSLENTDDVTVTNGEFKANLK